MPEEDKPLEWIGSSKKDLMGLPVAVRKFFGHALDFAQRGDKHDAAKVLNEALAKEMRNENTHH